jgi:Tat protein secretion system quality control protein TatD with DNase activity
MIQDEYDYIVGFVRNRIWPLSPISRDETQRKLKNKNERQIEWFMHKQKSPKNTISPVVIHTRNCSEITLKNSRKSGLEKFVIHCFSERLGALQKKYLRYLPEESKISFTGILTYPKSTLQLQEVAQKWHHLIV